MFNPKYSITPELLHNIKTITALIIQFNSRKYPQVVLAKFERLAHDVSSYASTSIEGNPLPLTDVKKLIRSKPENIRNTEREVINYNQALIWLENELKKSTRPIIFHNFIHRIHQMVMSELMPSVQLAGYRKEPVFVNDPIKRQTIYWPPDEQDVEILMGELLEFMKNNRKIDPLILSGIFHKQFVIIHPYIDGNGRTVRLITKAILTSMGLDTFNLFSFENYYNNNVTRYFEFVGEQGNYYDIVNQIDFTSWLVYFTGGIIDELLRIAKELDKESLTPHTVLLNHHKIILDHIDTNGFITDKIYSSLTKRAKATRNLDFQKLISLRIIKMKGKGKLTYYKRAI
jgi:Fic family protein